LTAADDESRREGSFVSKVFVLLSIAVAMAAANPVWTAIISEYQAAPDSLERVEVHLVN